MRRRPVEDDGEQDQGRQRDVARHGRHADDRRQGPRRPADDDVLRRRPLEQHGVDDDVEADRQQGQEGGQQVDQERQLGERDDPQGEAEDEGVLRRHGMRRERPAAGAGHQRVDVAVQVLVDGVRRSRRQRAADERRDDERQGRHAVRGQDHRRHGRDQQQLDDARLREGDVGAHDLAAARVRVVGDGQGQAARLHHRLAGLLAPVAWVPAGRAVGGGPGRSAGLAPGVDGGRHEQTPDGRAEADVKGLGPGGQVGEDLGRADDALDEEQGGARPDEQEQRRTGGGGTPGVALVAAPRHPGGPQHDEAGHQGHQPVEELQDLHLRDRRVGREGRHELAVEERPVGEDQRGTVAAHLRPEQEQGVDARGGERGQHGEALAGQARAQAGRILDADGDRDQDGEEEHGRGEVRRHRRRAVP